MTPTHSTTFDTAEFADELAAAPANHQVGLQVLFENAHVRIWDLALEPGERAPFHCHTTTYYWIALEAGEGVQRTPDGRLTPCVYRVGDVGFQMPTKASPLIHDLENTGTTTLRFSTVELLGA